MYRVNKVIRPIAIAEQRTWRRFKLITIFSLIFTLALSIILGVLVNYIIALVLILVYLGGLLGVYKYISKIQRGLRLKLHFNLALVLRNENDRLYSHYRLLARPGENSRWIEFSYKSNDQSMGSLR